MRKFNCLNIFGTSALLFALATSTANAEELGATSEPIKLAMLEWTGQNVTSHIAGNILESMGYKVEYVVAGNFPQFSGLADGSLSASVEVWLNNVGEIYPKALEAGQIVDIGPLKLQTREGWVYPSYMTDVCPGLPDFKALSEPGCAQALATAETFPNGRLLDYPADWGSRGATIAQNNNLPFTAVPSGSEGALVAELESAMAAKKPLLMMFWAPHSALADKDVSWVNLPPCEGEDQSQCITPPDVAKIVWSGFKDKWPAANAFLQNFEMNADQQQQLMMQIERKGESLDVATKAWVEANKATWQPWVDAALAN